MPGIEKKDILKWWREARFGMFIHWGLYAVPAGLWKGKEIKGIGEWIMHKARIPVKEYEKLAGKFNPVLFDAEQWVSLVKEAGMKYLVITSKHHDGFAMFESPSDPYNIVAATPYKSDPMRDLAAACKKAGIKLCFYYSQDQDWHEPGATGNDWDFPHKTDRDFTRYIARKVKPQVKEILTQYGPIGLIWFDTPFSITKSQSLDLKRFVHSLQPTCLVSGRVGNDVGDYGSMGDNQIPAGRVKGDWETPATMNNTWGFKKNDRNWKSTKVLLQLLVDLASKGVNYLLNVGPTARGTIPAASVKRLKEIGAWMRINGEAVYGTSASPYPYELEWGRMTCKPGKLYLHFDKWPKALFILMGLMNKVKSVYLLSDRRVKIGFHQEKYTAKQLFKLELDLRGKKPDRYISVVVLEIAGKARVDESIFQQGSGNISLPAHLANLHLPAKGSAMRLDRSGIIANWTKRSSWMDWKFWVTEPGIFEVWLITTASIKPRIWKGGHIVEVTVAGQKLRKNLEADEVIKSPRFEHFPACSSKLGKMLIDRSGEYNLRLKALEMKEGVPGGLQVSEIKLIKIRP